LETAPSRSRPPSRSSTSRRAELATDINPRLDVESLQETI
jgi:hypothetical protein